MTAMQTRPLISCCLDDGQGARTIVADLRAANKAVEYAIQTADAGAKFKSKGTGWKDMIAVAVRAAMPTHWTGVHFISFASKIARQFADLQYKLKRAHFSQESR